MERFDRFMDRCLYGPDGFYATTGSAGRRGGDFITSPEVGPLFGAVLANAIDRWWEQLGRPDPLVIYDVGCGPGTLARSIALARPDRPWELIGVDTVSSAGATIGELPEDLTGAIVIANELLDNMPFRVLVADDDTPTELYVSENPPVEHLVPIAADVRPPSGIETLASGTRLPLLDAAREWVTTVLASNPAVVCLVDYGSPTTTELATRGGWLRTYRDHQRGNDPLLEPGRWDITTDVAWDQLPMPDRLEPQREFLERWGIQPLVDEGREYWRANAARPDLAAIRMRSRISESEALLDPDGLGGWWVATWTTDSLDSGVV